MTYEKKPSLSQEMSIMFDMELQLLFCIFDGGFLAGGGDAVSAFCAVSFLIRLWCYSFLLSLNLNLTSFRISATFFSVYTCIYLFLWLLCFNIYIYLYIFYVQSHLFKNVTQGKGILLTSSPNLYLRDLKPF